MNRGAERHSKELVQTHWPKFNTSTLLEKFLRPLCCFAPPLSILVYQEPLSGIASIELIFRNLDLSLFIAR